MKAHPALIAQAEQTEKEIVEMAPGVWSAIGFAASNVHMIEGADSVTIIDTTETTQAAENILTLFKKNCPKPVGRIIYTHSHRDHISGASVFSEGNNIPIIASHLFKSDLVDVDEDLIAARKSLMRRTMMQFGIGLTDAQRISLGVGPGDRPMTGMGAGFIAPTDIITEDCDIDLDGVAARLIHAPGETEDHLMVWLLKEKILFCGDNWYHAFPNLYAIRGTAYRDFQKWADSLTLMASLGARILAPGHTKIVFGEEHIVEVLTTTRDAILHVMRETAKGMDEGLPLDDICATLTLPEDLQEKPWLQEFYGKLAWSARAFAAGTMGWYDGNPTHLASLTSHARAQRMADIAGGVDALMDVAKNATKNTAKNATKAAANTGGKTTDGLQWQLELCDYLIALGAPAEGLKADALMQLAETEINATARNTYIWAAEEIKKSLA